MDVDRLPDLLDDAVADNAESMDEEEVAVKVVSTLGPRERLEHLCLELSQGRFIEDSIMAAAAAAAAAEHELLQLARTNPEIFVGGILSYIIKIRDPILKVETFEAIHSASTPDVFL